MKARNNAACVVPLDTLIVDGDGTCRVCMLHEPNLESIMDMPDIGSTWKTALRVPLLWHTHDHHAIWRGVDANTLREQQKNHTWPDRCRGCKTAEMRGTRSPRQDANAKQPELLISGKDLKALPTRLTLRTAGHAVRHFMGDAQRSKPLRWERELAFWVASLPEFHADHLHMPAWIANLYPNLKYHPINPDRYAKELENHTHWANQQIAIDNLTALSGTLNELTLSGGDPLLEPNLAQHLDILLDAGRTDCKINVNTMLLGWHDSVMSKLAEFDDCTINVHIDGHDKVDQWLRYQSHWHVTTELFDRLLETKRVQIKVYTQLSAVNVLYLPDLLAWLRSVCERHQRLVTWTPIITHAPSEMRIDILPESARMAVADKLAAFRDSQDNQYPLYCWDGIDQANIMLRSHLPEEGKRLLRLRELLDWQQALRRNPLVRKWLAWGEDQDWQHVFPLLDDCLPRRQ